MGIGVLTAADVAVGILSFWNHKEASMREIVSPHRTPIGLLKWAPYGNRLISSDHDGLLVVWRIDVRGYVSQCAQYRRPGVITQCAFCTSPQQREKVRRRYVSIENGRSKNIICLLVRLPKTFARLFSLGVRMAQCTTQMIWAT